MSDNNFVTWLQAEMRRQSLTASELSRRGGADKGVVSRVLNSERAASPKTLRAIADGLNLPESVVFEKAGILRPEQAWSDLLRTLVALTSTMPPADQEDILEYARMRYRLAKRKTKAHSA